MDGTRRNGPRSGADGHFGNAKLIFWKGLPAPPPPPNPLLSGGHPKGVAACVRRISSRSFQEGHWEIALRPTSSVTY